MATRTVTWCTEEALDCVAELPTTVYLCVPASMVPDPVDDDVAIVNATATAVRDSKVTDSCGACGYVYTFEYDDTQLVENQVLVSASINDAFCKSCLTVFIESLTAVDLRSMISASDTESLDLTYDSMTGVMSGEVIVSPTAGNQLSLDGAGLFVPAMPGFTAVDTASVDITIAGANLSADVKLSADAGNIQEIRADGLFVPPLGALTVTDTATVDLTLAGMDVTADVKVSTDALNVLQARANGLWVPSQDGWIQDLGGFAYASATTITVATDATLRYQVGDRIKLTQAATVKYFVVTSVAATTLTITGGTAYTFTNNAITLPHYSHAASPVGFPRRFEWAPTLTASGAMTVSALTNYETYFSVLGSDVFFNLTVGFTLGGVVNQFVYPTTPINGIGTTDAQVQFYAGLYNNTTHSMGGWRALVTEFLVQFSNGANWVLGANNLINIQGRYSIG